MAEDKKILPEHLQQFKQAGTKITILSVPDFYSARLADEVGIHCILIGDSLGRFIQGQDDVFSVTTGDIYYYTKIVNRAVSKAMVIADMPYSSYELGPSEALENAKILISGGAKAVKLEGGKDYFPSIKALIHAGIPTMGHLGLKDTYYRKLGGMTLTESAKNPDWTKIIEQSLELEKMGVFALMLECVPAVLGAMVAKKLKIPVIGQGAGASVDGQCLIFHDMMGFHEGFRPKFVKRYARLSQVMSSSVKAYIEDVHSMKFPAEEHEY